MTADNNTTDSSIDNYETIADHITGGAELEEKVAKQEIKDDLQAAGVSLEHVTTIDNIDTQSMTARVVFDSVEHCGQAHGAIGSVDTDYYLDFYHNVSEQEVMQNLTSLDKVERRHINDISINKDTVEVVCHPMTWEGGSIKSQLHSLATTRTYVQG